MALSQPSLPHPNALPLSANSPSSSSSSSTPNHSHHSHHSHRSHHWLPSPLPFSPPPSSAPSFHPTAMATSAPYANGNGMNMNRRGPAQLDSIDIVNLDTELNFFRTSDSRREQLLRALLDKTHTLQAAYESKCEDLENEREGRRIWQRKAQKLEAEVNKKPFVLVLLDGDGMLFADRLIQAGPQGGAEAAQSLNSEIRNYITSTMGASGEVDIVVNIFLNLRGLASKLAACGIIQNPPDLLNWTAAFSVNQSLFSIIDVGVGKERADHKIKETFRLYIDNYHCKHILFGGCHDSGYLTFLDAYKLSDKAQKITLVQSYETENATLAQFQALNFRMTSFPSLFRSSMLPAVVKAKQTESPTQQTATLASRPQAMGTTRSTPGPQQNATAPPPASSGPPGPAWTSTNAHSGQTYSSIGGPNTQAKVINVASAKQASTVKKIFLNAESQRVDLPLPRADRQSLMRVESKITNQGKLCNEYHLNGRCSNGTACDYYHGERLTGNEQLALRVKARNRLCTRGSECVNPTCFFGHNCPNDYCTYENCYFKHLHGMDKIAKMTMDEHGEIEILKSR